MKKFSSLLLLFALLFNFIPFTHAATSGGYIPNADIKEDPLGVLDSHSMASPMGKTPFAVDHSSGSATYSYPLALPPGREGTTPSLSLNYNSGNRNSFSPLGYGWELSSAYIVRDDRHGINHLYDNTNAFNLNLFGASAELVPISLQDASHGDYGEKIQTLSNHYTFESDNRWVMTTPEGIRYTFGSDSESRQLDPDNTSRIYKWMLEEVRDLNANTITFDYFKTDNEIYPSTIRYSGHDTLFTLNDPLFTVSFYYEDRTDPGITYHSGFKVLTKKRLSKIVASEDASGSMREWLLKYTKGINGTRSLLKQIIEQSVSSEGTLLTLPATTFNYSTAQPSWSKTTPSSDPVPVEFVGNSGSDNGNELSDVNGDGYVDIVASRIPDLSQGANPCDGNTCFKKDKPTTYLNTSQNGWEENSEWNTGLNFESNITSLIDLNGDLLPEIYRPKNSKDGKDNHEGVRVNHGKGWSEASQFDTNATSDEGYRFVDVNGDGLADRLKNAAASYNAPGGSIEFNNGFMDWEASGWLLPATTTFGTQFNLDSGLRFAELNGDGLTDVILAVRYDSETDSDTEPEQTIQKVYLNNGKNGWTEEPNFSIPAAFTKIYYTNTWNASTENNQCLYDINGDGLIDWRTGSTNPGLNTGTHLNIQNSTVSNGLPQCGANVGSSSISAYRTEDINGDGFMDQFDTSESSADTLLLSQSSGIPDLLKSISLSTGGSVQLEYTLSTQYKQNNSLLNPQLPFAIATISKVTLDDEMGGVHSTQYTYENGRYHHYDKFRSEFSGFSKVTEKDEQQMSVYYFDQGCGAKDNCSNPLLFSGTLLKSNSHETIWIIDGSHKRGFTSASAFYNSGFSSHDVQLVDSAFLDSIPTGKSWESEKDHLESAVNLSRYANKQKLIRHDIYDPQGKKYFQKNYTWNVDPLEFGRYFPYLQLHSELAFDGEATHRDRAVEYRYDSGTGKLLEQKEWGEVKVDSTTGNILDTLPGDERKTVFTYTPNADENWIRPDRQTRYDSDSKRIQDIRYAYDANGNLIRTSQWLEKEDRWINTGIEVNSYGSPTEITDALGHTTSIEEDAFHLYPQTVINPLGHRTTTDYDYLSGKVLESTDANGLTSRFTYDGMGRLLKTYLPDPQTGVPTLSKEMHYHDDAFPRFTQTLQKIGDASLESRIYTDGMGRGIQTWSPSKEGNFIVTDQWYDGVGNVQQQSIPYEMASPEGGERNTQAEKSAFKYDPLHRLISETRLTGASQHRYVRWMETQIDPNGHSKRLYSDGYNQLIQVEEITGASVASTLYGYDGAGQLIQMTDAQGNQRHFNYDSLGRKTLEEDWHAPSSQNYGIWKYTYNDNGQRVTQADPKGQRMAWEYDELGRVLHEDWNQDGSKDIRYAYDEGDNGIGRLAQVNRDDVVVNYTYDAVGNIQSETKTIGNKTYVTETNYDNLNRVESIRYPEDAFSLQYSYDSAGHLNGIRSSDNQILIADIEYSPHGAWNKLTYGNGVQLKRTYDPKKDRRLTRQVLATPYNSSDGDGDGYESLAVGGNDCDDSNASVNPSAEADPARFDGIDQNCDGFDYRPDGTVKVPVAEGKQREIFTYEASKGADGLAESEEDKQPWGTIKFADAQAACEAIGGP
ncbi:MAG: hypothetical protein ACD_28C00002G0002, partial [uncultured bacterium]